MNKKLFPPEIIDNSYEQLVSKLSTRSHLLYIILLSVIISLLITSFFVYYDVGVTATGIIKPSGEHIVASAPSNGILDCFCWNENDQIFQGDTLFVVHSDMNHSQLSALLHRKSELEDMLYDLSFLVKGMKPHEFHSMNYHHSYQYFLIQNDELKTKSELAQKRFRREKFLYENKASALADFEVIESDYHQSILAVNSHEQKMITQWQQDQTSYQNELQGIETQLNQISIYDEESVFISPINGHVFRILNVTEKSYVQSGQQLLELAQDGNLVAECFVKTSDIGLITLNMPVKLRIDAFDYTQWGFISGSVQDISNDVTITNNVAYFKVYCSLNKDSLSLKNGHVGYIKNGMTVNARMVVCQRTISQLIYDKIDNWLNPSL